MTTLVSIGAYDCVIDPEPEFFVPHWGGVALYSSFHIEGDEWPAQWVQPFIGSRWHFGIAKGLGLICLN